MNDKDFIFYVIKILILVVDYIFQLWQFIQEDGYGYVLHMKLMLELYEGAKNTKMRIIQESSKDFGFRDTYVNYTRMIIFIYIIDL